MNTAAVARGFGTPTASGVKGARHKANPARRNARGIAFALLLPLLLTSCSIFQRSEAYKCTKAQGHVAKAIYLCPNVAELRSDTITITLPGDSAGGTSLFREAHIDSVLADCEQLREALRAERELFAIVIDSNAGVIIHQHRQLDSLLHVRNAAKHQLIARLCVIQPVNDSTALYHLRIWYADGAIHHRLVLHERDTTVLDTRQVIKSGPVEISGGRNGWLVAGLLLGWLVAVVATLHFISERGLRLREKERRG